MNTRRLVNGGPAEADRSTGDTEPLVSHLAVRRQINWTFIQPPEQYLRQWEGLMRDANEPTMTGDLSFVHPLLRISKSFRTLLNMKLEAIGLVKGQDELLIALTGGPQIVTKLAEILNIRPSSASKTVDVISSKGLVKREHVEHDMRMTAVALTDKGHEAIAHIRAIHAELDRELALHRTSNGRMFDPSTLGQLSELVDARLARLR